jgi:hypothetical protein
VVRRRHTIQGRRNRRYQRELKTTLGLLLCCAKAAADAIKVTIVRPQTNRFMPASFMAVLPSRNLLSISIKQLMCAQSANIFGATRLRPELQ